MLNSLDDIVRNLSFGWRIISPKRSKPMMMCRGFGKRRWGFSQRQSPQSSRLLGAKLGGVSGMENTFLLGALTLFFMSLPPSFFFLSLLYFVSFFFPKTPNKTEKVVVGFRYARRNLFFLLPCGRTFPWSATWLLTIFSYHCHRIFFMILPRLWTWLLNDSDSTNVC